MYAMIKIRSMEINFFFMWNNRGMIAKPKVVIKYSGIVEINRLIGKIKILSIPKNDPVEPSPSINDIYPSLKFPTLKKGKIGSLKYI